ncbi:hypothetical protein EON67_03240 [archaeon]|nr:MAG: hypothetical protein EON67_03240 [archaeon]
MAMGGVRTNAAQAAGARVGASRGAHVLMLGSDMNSKMSFARSSVFLVGENAFVTMSPQISPVSLHEWEYGSRETPCVCARARVRPACRELARACARPA